MGNQLMKLLVEEVAVSVSTVATRTSKVITLTKQSVKLKPSKSKAGEIQCKERGVLSPEQVEVETELDCIVLALFSKP